MAGIRTGKKVAPEWVDVFVGISEFLRDRSA
jgi:hypothetical protein